MGEEDEEDDQMAGWNICPDYQEWLGTQAACGMEMGEKEHQHDLQLACRSVLAAAEPSSAVV